MKTLQKSQITFFAPAGRDSEKELKRLKHAIESDPLFQNTIDAMPEGVLILNQLRQLVGCNQAARDLLGAVSDEVIGKRPGELVHCINIQAGPDGCGTSKFCKECGAVNAILQSQREHSQVSRECRIIKESEKEDNAMDLNFTATAFDLGSETYTVCFIKDISHRKRLEVLNKIFFHDVLNTVGGIHGIAEMLSEDVPEEGDEENLHQLIFLSGQLIEEIQAQRDLMYAESGTLQTHYETVDTVPLLENLCALYGMHSVANKRTIKLKNIWDGSIVTDRKLIFRVLGNMLKNALEATETGGEVIVRCTEQDDSVVFSVWNALVIPEPVQLQMFQRSFSTKASSGRGIGTHSMKLLGETYLGGQVTFFSEAPEGTTFTFKLPKKPSTESAENLQPSAAAQLPQSLHGKVLLAEDGLDNQRLISFVLKKFGLEVDWAENGRLAYEMALESEEKGAPYDLILMDVQMPEMDGPETTRHLREDDWQGPIIALTALDTTEDLQKCLAAGCNNCIQKPIDHKTLLMTIAEYLQGSKKS